MKQIRLSHYSSNDLTRYLERGFVDDELEQIQLALEDGLPIDTWLTDDMYIQQIYEIESVCTRNWMSLSMRILSTIGCR